MIKSEFEAGEEMFLTGEKLPWPQQQSDVHRGWLRAMVAMLEELDFAAEICRANLYEVAE